MAWNSYKVFPKEWQMYKYDNPHSNIHHFIHTAAFSSICNYTANTAVP